MTFSAFAYQGFLHSTDALPVLLVTSTLPTLVFGIFRAEYAVSFGYAGAMLLSGWVALASGGLSAGTLYHASLLASYGARLGVFILWRKVCLLLWLVCALRTWLSGGCLLWFMQNIYISCPVPAAFPSPGSKQGVFALIPRPEAHSAFRV